METIKLDLIPGKKMPSLHASQFDDGRAYHIDLTENRVPYVLDGTETISVIIRKCDNTLVSMDIANTFANKSYLEFEVTEQMTACSGFNYGEIILEKNGDRLGSLNFYLQVEAAPDENGITSTSEVLNLKRQVSELVAEELADNGAEETGYDNTESGLEATNVQDAIDEVNAKIENIPSVDAYTKEEANDKFATKTALQTVANAVEGKASASEVENIRIGADGTTYNSAGDAVRNQIEDVRNEILGLEVKRYPENIFDKSSMVVKNAVWYKASPVGKTFTTPSAQSNYNALTIPITGLGQNVTSVTLKQAKSSGTVNIYSWYAVDANMVALSSYENLSPAQSIENGYTISNIAEGTAYILVSLVYYNQAEAEGNHLSVAIGSTAKDYTPYFEPYTEAKSLTAEKALSEVEHKRSVMYIYNENNDILFFEAMKAAFDKGNVDVYIEKATYILENVYDYIRSEYGWTWTIGLPVGNGCRYFFNDSVIISNPPASDHFSDSRNIIDCRARGTDYEIHDVTLINNGGRYCIHDEGNNSEVKYCHKYENVIAIYKKTQYTPDTGAKAFGGGAGFDTSLMFDGCIFSNEDGQTITPVAIHAPTTNPDNLPCKLHLIMKNSYINQETIYINVFDENRDTVDFFLFGNKFGAAFNNPIVNLIENNNTVIQEV